MLFIDCDIGCICTGRLTVDGPVVKYSTPAVFLSMSPRRWTYVLLLPLISSVLPTWQAASGTVIHYYAIGFGSWLDGGWRRCVVPLMEDDDISKVRGWLGVAIASISHEDKKRCGAWRYWHCETGCARRLGLHKTKKDGKAITTFLLVVRQREVLRMAIWASQNDSYVM